MFQPRFDKRDDAHPVLVGKEKELYESKNWPKSFSTPVDITKVRIDAFEPWITKRLSELMGVDDDILVDYCMSQLKDLGESDAKRNSQLAGDGGLVFNEKPKLDPKRLQISLTGFMDKKAAIFVRELWGLLLLAQSNEHGIPQLFIDERKKEYENKNMDRGKDHLSGSRSRSNQLEGRYRHRNNQDSYNETKVKNELEHLQQSRHDRETHRTHRDRPRETEKLRDKERHRHRKQDDSERRHHSRKVHKHKHKSDRHRHRSHRDRSRRSRSSSKPRSSVSSVSSSDYHSRRHKPKSHSSSSSDYKHRKRRPEPDGSDSSLSSEPRHRRNRHRRVSSSPDYKSSSSSLDPGRIKEMSRKLARDKS